MPFDTFLIGLQRQKESRHSNGKHADKRYLRRLQRIRKGKYCREQSHQQGKDIFYKEETCRTLDVVYHAAPLQYHTGHMGKIRIQKHHLCRLCRRFAAGGHGNTAVGIFHSQNVIHAVPRHGNRVPCFLQCLYYHLLLLRCHTPKNRVPVCRLCQFTIRMQHTRIDKPLCIFNSRMARNLRYGFRIVARNNLYGNALLFKISKGFLCILPDRICQNDIPQRRHRFRQPLRPIFQRRASAKRKHPIAFFYIRIYFLRYQLLLPPKHNLRRPKHKAPFRKRNHAVFSRRRKRHGGKHLLFPSSFAFL